MTRGTLFRTTVTVFRFAVLCLVPIAAHAEVIFQDGFESGSVSAENWTYSGDLRVDEVSHSGTYAARIDDAGYLQTVVSTNGYEDITLSYARYTYAYDFHERLTVQWSTNGSSWNTIETYRGDWEVNQVQLEAGAGQQSTLYIRFSSNAFGYYERFRVDDVVISGNNGEFPPPPPPPPPPPSPCSCLPEVTDFTRSGPFDYTYRRVGNVKMWVPNNLPEDCRVPIIHLANGTGATSRMYRSILEHYASHGFIAACYENSQTGQGTQAIDAIETVIDEYPNIVDTKYGFTGHSQGGGGAIIAVYRAEEKWGTTRTYAGFGIEPAHGFGDSPINWETYYSQIKSPISMFNGSQDGLVSEIWVRSGYNALDESLEKAWYEAVGASHMTPVPLDYAKEFGLAWFRWQLLGDSAACQYFKNMPNTSTKWRLQAVDNLSPCINSCD